MSDDDLRNKSIPIGTRGKAGRGNTKGTPSSAARSLAPRAKSKTPSQPGATPAVRKPVVRKPVAAEAVPDNESTAASRPAAKRTTTKKHSSPKIEPSHLRAVTDEDAAVAAAAAAKRTHTASATPMAAGIPIDEIVVALIGAAQRILGADWEKRIAGILAGIRKRIAGDYEVDAFGFDSQITEIFAAAIEPIAEKWFRLEVRGVENIPTDGGALLVANHSGTVPIDGLITGYAVKKYSGRDLRPLGADLVFSLPFVGQIARKVGATLACAEDAERLLTTGEIAGVWPEGFKGIGKPFADRYKLQRFGRGGFVSSAMRAQVPIVPVSIVGAEEIYPLVGNVPSLARLLGLPYLPITPFFPLLGPLGLIPLPSKWIIEFGEPIRTDAFPPEAADDPMLLFNVTDQVRETIQQTLYKLLVDRGNAFF